jgi:hypothetical protein
MNHPCGVCGKIAPSLDLHKCPTMPEALETFARIVADAMVRAWNEAAVASPVQR